jgi:Transport protein particle (TRAPP) component
MTTTIQKFHLHGYRYKSFFSTYVSVPADFGGLSVDSYISGIIAGILEGSGFPARVTAHSVALEDGEAPPAVTGSGAYGSSNTGGGSGGSSSSAAAFQASYSLSELTGAPLLPTRKGKTVFLVKFAQSVLTRDSNMG